MNADPFRLAQQGSSQENNIMKTTNLYKGAVAFPLFLASMDSQDDLQVSVVASYQSNVKNRVESSNREYESSTLGLGWSMEVPRIVVRNRLVKESFDSSFYLVAEGGMYPLYRLGTEGGVINFYSVEHPYWKFYYFNALKESRWEIHKENGTAWVYGGDDSAIETRIHWDNWVGAASANGGEPFPVGWSLTSVKSFAGNSITYTYEKEEAQIGDCSYTRAIRLSKVVSTFGETAEIVYQDKEAFECIWPHSFKGSKNPYQFNYEDKFIDSIQVKNREGQLLYVQRLGYDFYDIFQKGQLYKKRFLTSATQVCYKDANMIPMPSMKFAYETNRQNPNPGALLQVTYPYGQKYQYSYKNDTLPASTPKVEFTKPRVEYTTSVYHALNYTVVLFQNQTTNIVRVYTWNVAWQSYEDRDIAKETIEDVQIHLGSDFFVMSYKMVNQGTYGYRLYKNNPLRQGEWTNEKVIQLNEGSRPAFTCSGTFFAVKPKSQNSLIVYQFNYLTNTWKRQDLPVEGFDAQAISGGENFILGAFYRDNAKSVRLQSFYIDANHQWQNGYLQDLSLEVNWQLTSWSTVWSLGACQAAATFVAMKSQDMVTSKIVLLRWGELFRLREIEVFTTEQKLGTKNPILTAMTSDSIVGLAENIFRYSPGRWNKTSLLQLKQGAAYAYAYGTDLALAVEQVDNQQRFVALRFDPYTHQWTSSGVPVSSVLPGDEPIYRPGVLGDYAVLGRGLFTRQPDEGWKLIYTLPGRTDGSSIALSNGFLMYQLQNSRDTYAVFFRNNEFYKQVKVDNQTFFSKDDTLPNVGLYSFTTYTGDQMATTQKIILHKIVNRDYSPKININYLNQVTLDTGFDEQSFYLSYQLSNATFSGEVPQYSRVRVNQAVQTGEYGSTEYSYFNGLNPSTPEAVYPPNSEFCNVRDYYSFFAGQLYCTTLFDDKGNLTNRDVNYLKALDTNGFCILPHKVVKETYLKPYSEGASGDWFCVSEEIETEYEIVFGQKKKIIKINTNHTGEQNRISQNFKYAWEVYPEFKKRNYVSAVVSTTKRNDTKNLVLEATAKEWVKDEFGNWGESNTYAYTGQEDAKFQFKGPQKGWLKINEVTSRLKNGSIVSQRALAGTVTTIMYDRLQGYPVAHFENACPDEVFYCGFESYEQNELWSPVDKTVDKDLMFEVGEFYGGNRCCWLNKGQGMTFSIKSGRGKYMISCALKTSGSVEGSGVYFGNTFVPFENTQNQWKIFYKAVDLGSISGKVDVRIVPANNGGKILVDALFVTPLLCDAEAYVYNRFMLTIGKHRNRREGSYVLNDGIQRPLMELTDAQTPLKASVFYNTRNGVNQKAAKGPDFTLTAEFPNGGQFTDFNRGDDYLKYWVVSEKGLQRRENTGPNYLFMFGTKLNTCQDISLSARGLTLQRNLASWELHSGGTLIGTVKINEKADSDYALIQFGERFTFMCNGTVLFSNKTEKSEPQPIKIESNNKLLLSYLMYAAEPTVKITYQDYVGKTLQDQSITEEGVLTMMPVYSPLGQATVLTKAVEAKNELWGYRTGFITDFNWDTGEMKGEAAEAYPEDGGFPYSRTKTTISPKPLPKELKQPGPVLAQHPVTMDYFTNSNQIFGGNINLPAGQYFVNLVQDGDGLSTYTLKDKLANKLADWKISEKDGTQSLTTYAYDDFGQQVLIKYPNYYDPSLSLSEREKFVSQIRYDFFGRVVERTDVDTGTTRLVYNRQGKLRFTQDAAGSEHGYYVYQMFDGRGNLTEIGSCSGVWDEAVLQEKADNPAFRPENGQWARQNYYDGTGDNRNLLGRLWKTLTYNGSEDHIVEEEFDYDSDGNMIMRRQKVLGQENILLAVYDRKGNPVKQQADNQEEMGYVYNTQGQLKEVYFEGKCLAAYTYNPSGKLSTETFLSGEPNQLLRNYSYNSADWLCSIKDPFFEQQIRYYDNADKAIYSGKIKAVSNKFLNSHAGPGFLKEYCMEYDYDGLGRLLSAVNSVGNEFSVSASNQWVYDKNSNMRKENEQELDYQSGSNRMVSRGTDSFQYNEFGSITQAKGLTLQYDKALQYVASLLSETKQIHTQFLYGGDGRKVAEVSQDRIKINVHNVKGNLFVQAEPKTGKRSCCLAGVGGVFSLVENGKSYYLVKDYQSSVRGIYDGQGLCASYNYQIFGEYLGQVYEEPQAKGLISFGFTGQLRDKDTGLYQMHSRWYDPTVGRFYSIDPARQYASPYIYGGSDWVNYMDPDGGWSWGAFAAIAGGILLVVAGAVLTVASAGIASPLGAGLVMVGGTFLLGAGIGSVFYGISSAIKGEFDYKDWLITAGLAGAFASLTALSGMAIPAGFTMFGMSAAATNIVLEVGIGVVIGGADGVITNGCLNVVHGKSFTENWVQSMVIGAVIGGVSSAVFGLVGAGRNLKTLHTKGGNHDVHIGLAGPKTQKLRHSMIAQDGDAWHDIWPRRGFGNPPRGELFHGHHVDLATIPRVPRNLVYNTGSNGFSLMTNNCTTYTTRTLATADLYAPLWARTPSTLYYWGKLVALF